MDIRNLFKHGKKDCYKPVRVGNFWSNNHIEYEAKGNRSKAPSVRRSSSIQITLKRYHK